MVRYLIFVVSRVLLCMVILELKCLFVLSMCFRSIEGDFDAYVKRIEQPYVWGGEPELLMASHVVK